MKIIKMYNEKSLILRILTGLVIGVVLGLLIPGRPFIPILGKLFVGALKSVAPILVLVLVISSLTQSNKGFDRRFSLVIVLYLTSTLIAAMTAVAASFMFPLTVKLTGSGSAVFGAFRSRVLAEKAKRLLSSRSHVKHLCHTQTDSVRIVEE